MSEVYKQTCTYFTYYTAPSCRGRRVEGTPDERVPLVNGHDPGDVGNINREELTQHIRDNPFIGHRYPNPVPRGRVPRQNGNGESPASSRSSGSRESVSQLVYALIDTSLLWRRVSPEGSGHSSLDPRHR